MRGWLKGDGGLWKGTKLNSKRKFVRTNDRNKYKLTGTSSSFELASQMYNIALRCGLHPCFKKRVSKYKIPLKDGRLESVTYDVYFPMKKDVEVLLEVSIGGRNCGRRKHKDGYMVTKINEVTKEYYTGKMYDLVTTNGNFWCMGNVKVHNCDPPYVPISKTANFSDYCKTGFGPEAHIGLAKLADRFEGRFFISNHHTPFTMDIYAGADKIIDIDVQRNIGSNSESRVKVKEILAIYEKEI